MLFCPYADVMPPDLPLLGTLSFSLLCAEVFTLMQPPIDLSLAEVHNFGGIGRRWKGAAGDGSGTHGEWILKVTPLVCQMTTLGEKGKHAAEGGC